MKACLTRVWLRRRRWARCAQIVPEDVGCGDLSDSVNFLRLRNLRVSYIPLKLAPRPAPNKHLHINYFIPGTAFQMHWFGCFGGLGLCGTDESARKKHTQESQAIQRVRWQTWYRHRVPYWTSSCRVSSASSEWLHILMPKE